MISLKHFIINLLLLLPILCFNQPTVPYLPFHAGLTSSLQSFKLPEKTIFIDPENNDDAKADGSIAHPFHNFENMAWKDGYCYAIKRNTVLKSSQIVIKANGITIAGYGKGKAPHIICTDTTKKYKNKHGITVQENGIENLTVRDIEISAPKATGCINVMKNSRGINIINCKFHNSYWGIRSIGNKNIFIKNCEIYNTNDDGIFIQYCKDIEISNCYIHHVNLNWKPPHTPESKAAGDGIQFDKCNQWHVHHNFIDRKESGNKFCFISNNPDQDNGILEYNILKGPGFDGSLIYIGDGKNLVIRYNYMSDCPGNPVYTHSLNLQFYGNIVVESGPIYTSQNALIFNNLFYNINSTLLKGNVIELSNNIFKTTRSSNKIEVNKLSGSNNLLVNGYPFKGAFLGNPEFKNAEKFDFRLTPGSDCIDAGSEIPEYIKDIEGNTVPISNGTDIGPFEFHE